MRAELRAQLVVGLRRDRSDRDRARVVHHDVDLPERAEHAADEAGRVRRIADVGDVGLDRAAFLGDLGTERRERLHVAPDGIHAVPRARGANGQGASNPG